MLMIKERKEQFDKVFQYVNRVEGDTNLLQVLVNKLFSKSNSNQNYELYQQLLDSIKKKRNVA